MAPTAPADDIDFTKMTDSEKQRYKALEAEFKKTAGVFGLNKKHFTEKAILAVLGKKFMETGETTATETNTLIDNTIKELTTANDKDVKSGNVNELKDFLSKKRIDLPETFIDGEILLGKTKKFGPYECRDRIQDVESKLGAIHKVIKNPPAVEVTEPAKKPDGRPAEQKKIDQPVPPAISPVVAGGNVTELEATFLNQLRNDLTVNGKMSGISVAIYNAVEANLKQSPGQTGWREMAEVAANAHEQVVDRVMRGEIKISDATGKNKIEAVKADKQTGAPARPSVSDNEIPNLFAKIKGTPDKYGNLQGGYEGDIREQEAIIKQQQDSLKKLALGADDKAKNKANKAIENANENIVKARKDIKETEAKIAGLRDEVDVGITKDTDWNKVVGRAMDAGFPELTDTPKQVAIRKAAGDKELNLSELKGLLKDLPAGSKILYHNADDAKDDTLTIGDVTISLGKMGLHLDPSLQDGEVAAASAGKKPAPKKGRN